MKYLRRKGKWKDGESKFVIEENNKYIKTVPKAEKLFEALRLVEKGVSPSHSREEVSNKQDQNFAQDLLNEPTEEEMERTLEETKTF